MCEKMGWLLEKRDCHPKGVFIQPLTFNLDKKVDVV